MRRSTGFSLGCLVLLGPGTALAQTHYQRPVIEFGVQLSGVPLNDRGWSATRPLVTFNVTSDTAVEAVFDLEVDRSGASVRDRMAAQIKRRIHLFERGSVFATAGIAAETRSFDYCRVPSFCDDRMFREPSGRRLDVGVQFGLGAEVQASRLLMIRADLQFVTAGDDAFVRGAAGFVVPVGRYTDLTAWRTGLTAPTGGPLVGLVPGQHVWITEQAGPPIEGEVIARSPATVTLRRLDRGGEVAIVPIDGVVRIETADRIRDGIWLGLAIGGGSGAVFGAIAGSTWCETRDCVGEGTLLFGGLGAAIGLVAGAVVDSLRVGRRVLYELPQGSRSGSIWLVPVVTRHGAGASGVIRW